MTMAGREDVPRYDETAITFSCAGRRLHGIRHLPLDAESPVPAVVILHGFTGNHVASFRKFVTLSRRLAARGVASLRFDFRGCGDSEGEFEDATIESMVLDAVKALRHVRDDLAIDPERVGVVGVSLGGLIAVNLMARDADLRKVVLWAPVGLPGMQLAIRHDEELDRRLREQGKAEIDGWMVGREFITQFEQQDPMALAQAMTDRDVLLIHGDADLVVPVKTAAAYRQSFARGNNALDLCLLQGADHSFGRIAWQEAAISRTVDWLVERL